MRTAVLPVSDITSDPGSVTQSYTQCPFIDALGKHILMTAAWDTQTRENNRMHSTPRDTGGWKIADPLYEMHTSDEYGRHVRKDLAHTCL
jgi:hypothetical protein